MFYRIILNLTELLCWYYHN